MISLTEGFLRRSVGYFGRIFDWYTWFIGQRVGAATVRRDQLWRFIVRMFGLGRARVQGVTACQIRMEIRLTEFAEVTAVIGRPEETFVAEEILSLPSGAVVVDAGANIGRYALLAARHVGPTGRVLAFEPNGEVFRKLARNAKLNQLTNIELFNCALGIQGGQLELYESADHGRSSLYPEWLQLSTSETGVCKQFVPVTTIDTILRDRGVTYVDLWKIDVEGAELDVIGGATDYLARRMFRRIICEVHEPLVTQQQFADGLGRFQYRVTCRAGFAVAKAC